MSLKVKCPHCLEPNKLIELQDQIEEWDEQNNVSCKNCGGDFILRADYVGYEARNHFDTENYLKARGLKVPDDVSEHAVRCWLEQYFGDFLGRGPEYIPEFWKSERWLKAREFALMAYEKRNTKEEIK